MSDFNIKSKAIEFIKNIMIGETPFSKKAMFSLKHPIFTFKYLRSRSLEFFTKERRLFLNHIGLFFTRDCLKLLRSYEYEEDILQVIKSFKREFGFLCYFSQVYLYPMIRALKPEIVIETGVADGVSTTFILQALEDNQIGKLYSIEISRSGRIGWLIPPGLKSRWQLIRGDSRDELPRLVRLLDFKGQKIDMFLHDSLHTYDHMLYEYETVWPCLRKGGLLVSHDINLNNAFFDFARKYRRKPVVISKIFGLIVK